MLATEVLDTETGEITPKVTFSTEQSYPTLEVAESHLFSLVEQGESLRLAQTRVLISIRDQQLYRERTDPKTGQGFASFEAYIKALASATAAFASDAPRTLKSWISRYLVYVDGLEMREEELVELGSHLEILLPAAARTRSCQLVEDDEELPTGGVRLGKEAFHRLTNDVAEKVRECRNNPDVDELKWGTKDTRELVKQMMGVETIESNLEFTAEPVGDDRVKFTGFVAFVDDIQYRLGDVIPLHDFIAFTKGHKVVGIESL